MQIRSTTTTYVPPVVHKRPSAMVHLEPRDEAALPPTAHAFSDLVSEAGLMPEVRSEVVDGYRARIHSGQYPSQDTLTGLMRLIASAVMHPSSVVGETGFE